MQVRMWLLRQKPEKSTTSELYLGSSADARSMLLGYSPPDRDTPKQSGRCQGRGGISPQTSHTDAELYSTHVVGRKIISTLAKHEGWRAGLGWVRNPWGVGPSGERQCVECVWMSTGPVKMVGLATCHNLRCVRGVRTESIMSVRRPGVDAGGFAVACGIAGRG